VTTSNLVINPSRHEVLCRGEPVALTATEFKLLHFLAHRPGLVFTRNHIIKALKGDDYPVTERSVDVQISGLRTKLSRAGHIIETIRGVGYRFND
jgi:two-component system phosphate regulon response regulator PhoB